MPEKHVRKTDRRTLYTKMVIKDAILNLLEKKAYSTITVADICREAEINRGTFYLHYDNISGILDELFDDALGSINGVYDQIARRETQDLSCGYPLCLFLRKSKKYQPLFFSSELQATAIKRIIESNEKDFVGNLQRQTGQSDEALLALLSFQLNGCFAVCKQTIDLPDEQWESIRSLIDRSLKRGYEDLEQI